jgi:hypothetical protein
MKRVSNVLTSEEQEQQCYLSDILYDGTQAAPLYPLSPSKQNQKMYKEAIGSGEKEQRFAALQWIDTMSSMEFEARLKNGTFPEFVREVDVPNHSTLEKPKLVRHNQVVTTEAPGYVNRNELRRLSLEQYIEKYY